MKVRYRETIEGVEVQAVFLASDLELRWLKAWGGCDVDNEGPDLIRDQLERVLGAHHEDVEWPFNLTDVTLSVAVVASLGKEAVRALEAGVGARLHVRLRAPPHCGVGAFGGACAIAR